MTTTTTETAGERNAREARESLDREMPRLPTVEQIAAPLLSAIWALHDLGDVTHDAAFLDDGALPESKILVELVEEVANLAEAAVNQCTHGDDRTSLGEAMRRIIFHIADIDGLRSQYHGGRCWAMTELVGGTT